MVGWHHQLNGHEFEQVLGNGDGQGSLVCCSPLFTCLFVYLLLWEVLDLSATILAVMVSVAHPDSSNCTR